MTTLCRQVRRVALVGLAVMAVGGAAAAQSQGGQTGRLMLEEIDNGWLISPDFRVTELEGETTQVAGVYGGWLMDHRFLIGAGAYWLVDGPNDTDLKYFGRSWGGPPTSAIGLTSRYAGWSGSARRPADSTSTAPQTGSGALGSRATGKDSRHLADIATISSSPSRT